MTVPMRRFVSLGLVLLMLVLLASSARDADGRLGPACATGSLPAPPPTRPHYLLRLRVLPSLRTVTGTLSVSFAAPTDRLVFRLWPNGGPYARRGARLSVSRVREGNRALPISRPDATTLVVGRPIFQGEEARVSMSWRLILPRGSGLRLKRGGRSVRLASFFPLLAWTGDGWALDPPTMLPFAEAWTSPTADFDVRVTHPPAFRVVASGQSLGRGRWRAEAVRDFALALGHFKIVTGQAHVPAPVKVTVALERASGTAAARTFLRHAVAALERYSALYGSYPWRTFTVAAMADLTNGMEYPTLVYQPASNTDMAHETAHQWFYSLVGNDQARDPWLDEGLTTWAEAAVNGAPPFSDAEIPPEVANKIGETMTFWDRFDERRFFLGAYLESYRALLSLGPRSEVDCALRSYVIHDAYRVARPRDLLDVLQTFFPEAEQKLARYGAHF
jgi:peptidase M1-like protein